MTYEYSCGKHFKKLSCFGWNCLFFRYFKELACVWKNKATPGIKQIYWKTVVVCLFVCLSVANISSSSRESGGLKRLESLSSHTLGLGVQVFRGFQSPESQTTPELGREWKFCFRRNFNNKKATYSSKLQLNQISKTSNILPNKVTVLGLSSCYDFRVYFCIICSWIMLVFVPMHWNLIAVFVQVRNAQ